MKPIFTIHAGEYLVGSHIESHLKDVKVWIPAKDTGVDLLLTDQKIKKTVSLQIKFSKDFLVTNMGDLFQRNLLSCCWWTLNREKLEKSEADYWIFVLYTFNHKNTHFVIIKPSDLLNLLDKIHSKQKIINSYLWVTEKNKCWEARGLKKQDHILIAEGDYSNEDRDFTRFLNNWDQITREIS